MRTASATRVHARLTPPWKPNGAGSEAAKWSRSAYFCRFVSRSGPPECIPPKECDAPQTNPPTLASNTYTRPCPLDLSLRRCDLSTCRASYRYDGAQFGSSDLCQVSRVRCRGPEEQSSGNRNGDVESHPVALCEDVNLASVTMRSAKQ